MISMGRATPRILGAHCSTGRVCDFIIYLSWGHSQHPSIKDTDYGELWPVSEEMSDIFFKTLGALIPGF